MLLCESFNPHVRYGSCMALGIACAGTGNAVRGGGPARPGQHLVVVGGARAFDISSRF